MANNDGEKEKEKNYTRQDPAWGIQRLLIDHISEYIERERDDDDEKLLDSFRLYIERRSSLAAISLT